MTIRNLEYAVRPKSLAIFGASEREESVGRIVMKNIIADGFEGDIWPVNPKVIAHPLFWHWRSAGDDVEDGLE